MTNNTTTSQKELDNCKKSLQYTSEAFEKIAADPKYHNSPISQYLDTMAYEMRCMRSTITEFEYNYGGL